MRITTIVENHSNELKNLSGEHGLSLLVENMEEKILFDTGQTDLILENADKLNIKLENVDKIVLSHGHYDHTGGYEGLIKKIGYKDTYVGKNFFNYKYRVKTDGSLYFNGNPFSNYDEIKNSPYIKAVNQEVFELSKGFYLFRDFKQRNNIEALNNRFRVKDSDSYNKYVVDDFQDEMAMVIENNKGIVIIVGCSHIGIINIVSTIKEYFNERIIGIIGGTHLIDAKKERLEYTCNFLEKLNLDFLAVSHCTGEENIEYLRDKFKGRFILNITGNSIHI